MTLVQSGAVAATMMLSDPYQSWQLNFEFVKGAINGLSAATACAQGHEGALTPS